MSNERRSNLRATTRQNDWLQTSLQQCTDPQLCMHKIKGLISTKPRSRDRLIGLIEVLQHMIVSNKFEHEDDEDQYSNNLIFRGYISLQEAYEIFSGYTENDSEVSTFRDIILRPDYGLPIHIITIPVEPYKILVLKTDTVNIPQLINLIVSSFQTNTQQKHKRIKDTDVLTVINSMDTEWDKSCARVIFSNDRSNSQLEALGLNAQHIAKNVEPVVSTAKDVENTYIAAGDLVTGRLAAKEDKMMEEVTQKEELLMKKQDLWPSSELEKVQDCIDDLKERIAESNKVKVC